MRRHRYAAIPLQTRSDVKQSIDEEEFVIGKAMLGMSVLRIGGIVQPFGCIRLQLLRIHSVQTHVHHLLND